MRVLLHWCVTLAIVLLAGVNLRPLGADELLPAEEPIERAIDYYLGASHAQAGIVPAPLTEDANLLRRTSLDLVGHIPTVAELDAYLASDAPQKRQQLVDRLMASPAFARHQASEFDTLLMYGNGSLLPYLLQSFRENRRWDEMFREMLLGSDDSDPKTNADRFVQTRAEDLDKLANDASVIFFGINISCAKCHDHPLVPEWTQDHFYGMKSFFSRTFENGDFVGERDYGSVTYKTVSGEQRDARLMFLSGAMIDEPKSEEPSDQEKKQEKKRLEQLKKDNQPPPAPRFSRRRQLVEVALRAEERHFLARAIVNRLWNRFFGRGLVMPVDQMHPENPASHPELLHWLARDFTAHRYDLRRLIRGMLLSDAYARSSHWDQQAARPPDDLFALGQLRPLTPHQLSTSLRLASTNPDSFPQDIAGAEFDERISSIETAARGFASLLDQPREDFQVSVGEALLFSNSERVQKELLRSDGDSLVGKLQHLPDHGQRIRTAVRNVLSREAKDDETKLLEAFLDKRADRPSDACRQLVWILMTSGEFRFNH